MTFHWRLQRCQIQARSDTQLGSDGRINTKLNVYDRSIGDDGVLPPGLLARMNSRKVSDAEATKEYMRWNIEANPDR